MKKVLKKDTIKKVYCRDQEIVVDNKSVTMIVI